jgi:hypothetical protein
MKVDTGSPSTTVSCGLDAIKSTVGTIGAADDATLLVSGVGRAIWSSP